MSRERERVVLMAFSVICIGVTLVAIFREQPGAVDVGGTQLTRDNGAAQSAGPRPDPATQAPSGGTTVTSAPGAVPPLPRADMSQPPAEPVGVYKQGKVTLRGSVPSDAVGAGYVRRMASVIGESNIVQEMKVDPRVTQRAIRVDVDEQFRFPAGSVAFDPRFAGLVDLGSVALKAFPETVLIVTGHSDSSGDPLVNLSLSRQRAQVIVDYMISQGIPPARVVAVGAGSSDPVADNSTPAGREANRRIEASLDGFRPE